MDENKKHLREAEELDDAMLDDAGGGWGPTEHLGIPPEVIKAPSTPVPPAPHAPTLFPDDLHRLMEQKTKDIKK